MVIDQYGDYFTMEIQKLEKRLSLKEIAYQTLKISILKLDLSNPAVAERLDERELAEKLNISRTPLREAINQLVLEGFLKVVPRKGIYVIRMTKSEFLEILLLRSVLEGLGARLAAKYASKEEIEEMKRMLKPLEYTESERGDWLLNYVKSHIDFHEYLLKASHCEALVKHSAGVFDRMRWIRAHAIGFPNRQRNSYSKHLQLVYAVEKREPEVAEKRMREHIEALANYVAEDVNFPD
jgi:DNA-binding GntR family transcriptional regulator